MSKPKTGPECQICMLDWWFETGIGSINTHTHTHTRYSMNKSRTERRASKWGSQGRVLNNVQWVWYRLIVCCCCCLSANTTTLKISTIAFGLSEEQWCVFTRPHSAEVTSEALAGYQMVLQGAHSVAASNNNTQNNSSDLYVNNVTSSAWVEQSAETISPLID